MSLSSIFPNNRRIKQVGKTYSHKIFKVETFSDSGKILKTVYEVRNNNPFFESVDYTSTTLAGARKWAKLHNSY